MSSIPPNFDPNSGPNGFKIDPGSFDEPPLPEDGTEIEPVVLSPQEQERLRTAQQRLRRLFLLLAGGGALLGLVVAIAIVLLLNRFGLVGTPEEPRQYQQILQILFSRILVF